MKNFFISLFLCQLVLVPAHAQEDAWSYTDSNQHPGDTIPMEAQELQEALQPSSAVEDNDPLESFNRGVFAVNDVIDEFFLERLSAMYRGVVPEFFRERVGYVLRNLSEPVVLVNNILQGEGQDAEDTLRRFLLNSTVGIGGLFDISTGLDIPYKKEDFGLTLASWGFNPGPYLVLPLLGPSNVRDSIGRIGDYTFDPINWWAYLDDRAVYSLSRTGAQIIDAKTDNIEIIRDLRRNAVDPYATFRAWYDARRKALAAGQDGQALDTPRPDDDD
jgi:phospholipid-binding lipoprotein MlaA